jgi:hypothetical protein
LIRGALKERDKAFVAFVGWALPAKRLQLKAKVFVGNAHLLFNHIYLVTSKGGFETMR